MRLLIIITIVFVLLPNILLAQDMDEGIENGFLIGGGILSAYCTGITIHNVARLHADSPSRIGGIAGVLFGVPTAIGGVGILTYKHFDHRGWGAPITLIGIVTTYYGVKNIIGARRKYFEEKEKNLTVSPLLRQDSPRSSSYGMMVEFSF